MGATSNVSEWFHVGAVPPSSCVGVRFMCGPHAMRQYGSCLPTDSTSFSDRAPMTVTCRSWSRSGALYAISQPNLHKHRSASAVGKRWRRGERTSPPPHDGRWKAITQRYSREAARHRGKRGAATRQTPALKRRPVKLAPAATDGCAAALSAGFCQSCAVCASGCLVVWCPCVRVCCCALTPACARGACS